MSLLVDVSLECCLGLRGQQGVASADQPSDWSTLILSSCSSQTMYRVVTLSLSI